MMPIVLLPGMIGLAAGAVVANNASETSEFASPRAFSWGGPLDFDHTFSFSSLVEVQEPFSHFCTPVESERRRFEGDTLLVEMRHFPACAPGLCAILRAGGTHQEGRALLRGEPLLRAEPLLRTQPLLHTDLRSPSREEPLHKTPSLAPPVQKSHTRRWLTAARRRCWSTGVSKSAGRISCLVSL